MTSEEAIPGGPTDPQDPAYARRLVAAQRLILSHIQPLHDRGIIDLDGPARNVVDAIHGQYPDTASEAESSDSEVANAAGYWLVGSQGWCNHLQSSRPEQGV